MGLVHRRLGVRVQYASPFKHQVCPIRPRVITETTSDIAQSTTGDRSRNTGIAVLPALEELAAVNPTRGIGRDEQGARALQAELRTANSPTNDRVYDEQFRVRAEGLFQRQDRNPSQVGANM